MPRGTWLRPLKINYHACRTLVLQQYPSHGVQEHPHTGWSKGGMSECIHPAGWSVTNGGGEVYPSRGVKCIPDIYIPLLHRGSFHFIAKECSIFLHTSDVGLTIHLHSHGVFLWSLEKHLLGVVSMIFHHDEVARMSFYKFHDWSIGGEDSFLTTDYTKYTWGEQHCDDADIIRAFDDAIDDSVDIISASLGGSVSEDYLTDSVAIGSFHAMRSGIFVSNAAGNDGPERKTVKALAPWLLSVAASTINRKFITKVQLGNGKIYEGLLPNSKDLEGKIYNLLYGGNVPNETEDVIDYQTYSLDKEKIKGKIVLCDYGPAQDTSDNGDGAIEGGAVGVILTSDQLSEQLSQSDYHFPVAAVGLEENSNIYNDINQTSNPTATLWKSEEIDDVLSPYHVLIKRSKSFESQHSQGDEVKHCLTYGLLQPDLAAPGSNILAAMPPNDRDNSNTRFELMSGTSMACPHAGVAAYVKSIHPEWSPAAILSALITTAKPMSVHTTQHVEFAYGAGLINPSRAPFPGLVYDLELQDYIDFLCSKGYRGKELEDITKDKTISCSSKSTNETTYNLNYASIALCIKDPESFSGIFHRTVTNVGSPNSRYKAKVMSPLGLKISVEPNELSFTSLQEKKSFVVKIEGPIEKSNIVSASMVWDDGNFQVRSPIVVYMDF
ncbi:hypothetical protein ACLB2K_074750 [Fragaria x ananassa]